MKREGFTLVELVVTIGLMALIGVIIGTNVINMFSNQEEADYEAFKKQIEDAACIYVETNWTSTERNNCREFSNCSIKIQKLIEDGLIDDDLKDPRTEASIASMQEKKVQITWPDNVKTCVFTE